MPTDRRVIVTIVLGLMIVIALSLGNAWLSRRIVDIENTSQPSEEIFYKDSRPQSHTSKPSNVVIDPLNDPLAPVIEAAPPPAAQTAPDQKTSPERNYELPTNSPIILQ